MFQKELFTLSRMQNSMTVRFYLGDAKQNREILILIPLVKPVGNSHLVLIESSQPDVAKQKYQLDFSCVFAYIYLYKR